MRQYNPWPARLLFLTILTLSILFLCLQAHAGTFIWGDAAAAGGGTWETIWTNPSSIQDYDNGSNWNERQLLTAAQTGGTGPWTKIRVTIYAESGTRSNVTASVCIQSSGSTCTAAPTSFTVSSASPFSVTGSTLTDEATFSFDTDDALLLHYWSPDGIGAYFYNSSYTEYYEVGGTDDTGETSLSGYTTDSNLVGTFELVEGWNPD